MSTKEKASEALRELPDTASWIEIEDRIHFPAAIERGRKDVREGKIVAHEDVKTALAEWTSQ